MEVIFIYIVCALAALLPAGRLIHIFQLESYKLPQLRLRLAEDQSIARGRRWLMYSATGTQMMVLTFFLGVSSLLLEYVYIPNLLLQTLIDLSPWILSTVAYLVELWIDWRKWRKQPSKKPLVYTARVKRLYAALGVVLLALFFAVYGTAVALAAVGILRLPYLVIFVFVVACEALALLFLPLWLKLAALIVQPVEKAVQSWYLNDARRILNTRQDLVRIGITGSYGKTSVKVILATILSGKFNVLATPASYNTPMGITRVVREQLKAEHEVFIAEMGARHIGDIKELCDLVHPKYGLLTSVGPQHLETMFTIENITKTKYELIESLPEDGIAFLPQDDGICLNLYRKTREPKRLFGLTSGGEELAMSARDIGHGPRGSHFTLVGPDGETVPCVTKLLGLHNIGNILGAAAVAHALGMTLGQIATGIARAQPVEHRLQLLDTGGGITVIDDAFNSNPAGARAALDVLADFPGRKIIVTPGLVELGDSEDAENERFGREMAKVVDIAILVARNGEAMRRGLLSAGFEENSMIMAPRLSDGTAALGKLTQPGDVVLFENDLPDHYEG